MPSLLLPFALAAASAFAPPPLVPLADAAAVNSSHYFSDTATDRSVCAQAGREEAAPPGHREARGPRRAHAGRGSSYTAVGLRQRRDGRRGRRGARRTPPPARRA